MKILISAAFLALLFVPAAHAAKIGAATKCSTVRADFHAKNKPVIRATMAYINSEWETLDDIHLKAGGRGLLFRMKDRDRFINEAKVAALCKGHPKETLKDASDEIYESVRSMNFEFRVAPE